MGWKQAGTWSGVCRAVSGPSGSTDTAIGTFDGTTGRELQDSGVTIDASGNVRLPTDTQVEWGGSNAYVYGNHSPCIVALVADAIYADTANSGDVVFRHGLSEYARFDTSNKGLHIGASGSVGASDQRLWLEQSASADCTLRMTRGASDAYLFQDQSDSDALSVQSSAHLKFLVGGATEKMRLTTAGYLGVGKTSPSYALDVSGTIAVDAGVVHAERSTAPTVSAGEGGFWVKDDAPSRPKFTDDAGTDFELLPLGMASLTVGASSTASASKYDVFDEDNYSSYSKTDNVTAEEITYTQSDGRFTFGVAGTFAIDLTLLLSVGSSQAVTISLEINGSEVFSFGPKMSSAGNPSSRALSILQTVSASDYLNCFVDGASDTVTIESGSTINIYRLK